ncbi:MAG: hypothetical protein AAB788_02435 [Patescibacteria group bacterium]
MTETPASRPPQKGKPVTKAKTVFIPGDFTGNINFGTGNSVNGQELKNPTLPSNAIVTESQEVSVEGVGQSLAYKIKTDVQAKLKKAGITEG